MNRFLVIVGFACLAALAGMVLYAVLGSILRMGPQWDFLTQRRRRWLDHMLADLSWKFGVLVFLGLVLLNYWKHH